MRRTLLVAVLVVAAACRRISDSSATTDASADVGVSPTTAAPPTVGPSRCHPAGAGVPLASPQDLELGDALALGDGWALGLVHRTPAGRVAAVAFLGKDVSSAQVVDLGATLGDAPPPRLAVRGADVVAASYLLPKKTDGRELALGLVSGAGTAKPLATITQQRDDSFAFDLSPGLVAWDEAVPGPTPRGVVRIAEVSADHAGAARDASPPDSDAEMPRILPTRDPSRSFVLWIARHPETARVVDAAAVDEATGEVRAQSWVEAVEVDAAGASVGPLRRLTPAAGHVSAFDATLLAAEARPTLLVVARDAGEAVDGSGGTLLRIRLREDGAEPPLGLPGDGLGRGAPTLVDGPLPWLAWIGPHEELRLLALDAAGAPAAPPTAEPLLDESRVLAILGGDRVLVGAPGDAAASLQVFTCPR